MNTISYRKIFALTAIVAVLFIGSTHAVSAADSSTIKNLFSCSLTSGNLVTCATYGLGVVIQEILILFVQLGGLITRIALQVNDHIFDSPYIQTGFSVTLAIANLGFVLGIIVIALATILRSQSYGMKQLLWKLVVMAILVNFGLVIARPIVSTSDSLTQYFINAVGGGNGYDGLVNNLTGTFKPGALLAPPSTGTTLTSIGCNILGAGGLFSPVVSTCQQLASLISQKTGVGNISPPDSFTQTLMGLVLATLLTGFVAIVMLTLGILLVLRYVALGLLLVILPFAWLAWVFPQFKSWFNKWWSEFIRWTFFPPAVLFFIYLALTVISNQKYVGDATVPANGVDGILGGLALSTGVAPLVTQVATEFIFIALMVGGVMMAASLSGKAGAVVVDGAKSASKWIGGYVGRRSKQAATAPLRSERTRAWAARLQQPDRNPLARWTGRLVMGTAIAGGESAAKAAAKDIEGDTPDQNRQKIATTAYAPKRIARIEKAIKDNKVKEFTDEENEKYFGKR
ncbi:MAG: hypothetical protein M1282_01025, partial [Chloroflexi bacterium]|nr:hypothetical protein [Chloroflexota bacterium]